MAQILSDRNTIYYAHTGSDPAFLAGKNFRINDIVEGFVQDGLSVDVLCGLPNYPKGEWFDGYSADGPFEEVYKGARVFRAREIPRKGNTGKTIFLNYVSWPLYAAGR